MDENELDLSNLNLEDLDLNELEKVKDEHLENLEDVKDIVDKELNLAELIDEDIEDNGLESNDIIDKVDDLTLGLSQEQIYEFYDYLAGKASRPIFAEKFFADGESRIRESNQLTTLMGISFIPKLLAVQQSIIDNLCSPSNLKYLSNDEKLSYLQTFAAMSTKFNQIAADYVKQSRDFAGVPLIYRQLLDQLLQVSEDKLPRLKMLPLLIDVDEDTWNRIIEITKLK